MSLPYVLITGDSEGLGNAVTHALLRRRPAVRVLGVSRRPTEQVRGLSRLDAEALGRYERLQADLACPQSVKGVLAQVRERLTRAGAELRALLLVNGTGFLDSQVRQDPSLYTLMEQLNVETPLSFVRELSREPALLGPRSRVFYYSGLVTHPSVTDPLLTMHAALKTRAVEELRSLCGDRLTSVMPGAYMTPMLERAIARHDSLLEWFAVPVGDPYARGGLADAVAKLAVSHKGKAPATLIRPRINKLLVETQTPQQMLEALPGAIVRCARAVLAQTGQSDAQHDERVAYLERHRLYGNDFPYHAIRSERLWPRWLSIAYARVLAGLTLTR